MGTGKSTVGKLLALGTGLIFIDTDELISAQYGMSIGDIFDVYGEDDFRNTETDVLGDISSVEDRCIVSCGGGLPIRSKNREILKSSGTVILLEAEPEEILKRIEKDESRPLLKNKKSISEISKMLEARHDAYIDVADLIISTNGKLPTEIAAEISDQFSN
ncbi:MAG: shikimate kinase [Firmicutes bacterium]|nr:shikimate kinase [Bacillota bacterium]